MHALGQVAHVELQASMPADVLRMKLNDELPSDVHVLAVQPVGRRFHARHGALTRSYLYQISRRRTALAKPFVWWIKDDLDVRRMAEAAALFRGMHDFQSFTDLDPEEGSTRVLLEGCEVAEEGALILVRVVGSHFLWKMVRRAGGRAGRGGPRHPRHRRRRRLPERAVRRSRPAHRAAVGPLPGGGVLRGRRGSARLARGGARSGIHGPEGGFGRGPDRGVPAAAAARAAALTSRPAAAAR